MIIDAHSHVYVPTSDSEETALNSYGMTTSNIDTYLDAYQSNHVDGCFVFGIDFNIESGFEKYNDYLGKLGEQYKDRLFPFASICPFWHVNHIRREIERSICELGLFGLKFVPVRQGNSLASKEMDIVAETCIKLKVPVYFHDGSPEYCSAIQIAYFARKYPELTVVSGHGGLRELWTDYVTAAQTLPNLYICLSGPTQWGIQELYDQLGPEKLLFGSDGGIGHPAITAAYIRRIERMNAPKAHKDMIMGLNAARLLNITSNG